MAILDFHSRSAPRRGTLAASPASKERLAIVSSSDRLCGIASYTATLQSHLSDVFDVTVFELDQYLLRATHPRVRWFGDQHIKEICRALARFDAVNLQLEHGTLGRRAVDIHRRFGRIVAAAPRLSVTFHTLPIWNPFDLAAAGRAVARRDFRAAAGLWRDFRRNSLLSFGIAQHLRQAQRKKPVTAIAHNRRDARDLRYIYGIEDVIDHPLAFLSAAEAMAIRQRASRRHFPVLDNVPADAKLVGVFGFLSEYKGFGTAVRAMRRLPDDYHLLIFGGTHPNEIPAARRIHPYLSSLLDDANANRSVYEDLTAERPHGASLALSIDGDLDALVGLHPLDLSNRVHFMGALPDADFLTGMAICDAVVFPYLEVGQSASGPISQALELGCRVIASRTRAFLEFGRYHPDSFDSFEIGNHVELAARILARPYFGPPPSALPFDVESNKEIYFRANSNLARRREVTQRWRPMPPDAAGEQVTR